MTSENLESSVRYGKMDGEEKSNVTLRSYSKKEDVAPESNQSDVPLLQDDKNAFVESSANTNGSPLSDIPESPDLNGKPNANGNVNNIDVTLTKGIILKNLAVVTLAFVFLFSAFMSFSNLQSTVNIEAGLGTIGIATIYVAMIVSGFLLPPITLSKFSYKWVMVVAMGTYLVYLATGFYASWATVIPASVIIGIGASHLWPAQQAYLAQLAPQYAAITRTTEKQAINFFFGIFYGLFFTTQIWGNLISSLVFSRGDGNETSGSDTPWLCGANLCPYDVKTDGNVTVVQATDNTKLHIFTGFCIGLGLLSMASAALLLTNIPSKSTSRESICTQLSGVFRHLTRNRDQQLFIAPTILRGMSQAFMASDYTVAFVSCPLGVKYVGFVMIAYGVSSSTFTVLFERLSTRFKSSQVYLFIAAFLVQMPVIITMFLWQPDRNYPVIMFALAALWAIGDAVYSPTMAGLYSTTFKENSNVALSCLRLLDSLGWAVAFGYSHFLCVRHKLVVYTTILVLSVISILVQAFMHKRQKQRTERS